MSDDETVSLSIDKAGAPRFYFLVVPGCEILYDNEVLAPKITTRYADQSHSLERQTFNYEQRSLSMSHSIPATMCTDHRVVYNGASWCNVGSPACADITCPRHGRGDCCADGMYILYEDILRNAKKIVHIA